MTDIGFSAFQNCTGFTSVTVPNSVTFLGRDAFAGCINVKELIYVEGCTTAFRTSLQYIEKVTIPNTVTKIDYSAFEGCTSLTSVTIPNSVTSIESSAFKNCEGLTSITIPNSVTYVGMYAFEGCENVKDLIYAEGCTYAMATSLDYIEKVTIPNSVKTIARGVFYRISSLTCVNYQGTDYTSKSKLSEALRKGGVYFVNDIFDGTGLSR